MTEASEIPASRVRLDSPAALVAAVPYLLGFHPERSLVAVGLAARGRQIAVCGRADWPSLAHSGAIASSLAMQLRRAGSGSAVLIAYPGAAGGGRRVAEAAAALFEVIGLVVLDVVQVSRGKLRSYRCRDRACCPTAVPPPSSALAAAMVAEGRRVLADRAELVAVLGSPPATVRVVPPQGPSGSATASGSVLAELDEAIGALPERLPAEPDLVRWAVALREPSVRGACAGHLRGERAEAAEALWLAMVRVAPRPMGAAPACLLALHAYARGDGAFARVCLERALEHDPGESLAHDLHALLDLGVPPDQLLLAIDDEGGARSPSGLGGA